MVKLPARLVFLLVLLLASCGTPPQASPPAAPQPVFLSYPPELRPYAEVLGECARQYPEIALYLEESLSEPTPNGRTSLFLAVMSQPAALSDWQPFLLDEDALLVIANQASSLEVLSTAELRAVWSGSRADVHVWTYPQGNALRALFDSVVMGAGLTSSAAYLAPDPAAALEAVAADPLALVYLPAAWLDSASPELTQAVHTISLPEVLNENLRLPVIALAEAPIQDSLRTLLLCAQ